ncbi:hypothetical protein BDN70DRAFT_374546 [Pholiota conissans]|uniref:Uncharacterized protein n=1 Tax=Pholiota conissans TaxID=109636 RepID=A0A9P5Z7P5_9AGAR|nr:hypothetical protein BDN70DRAFT_374546 [Pholiota conissans]
MATTQSSTTLPGNSTRIPVSPTLTSSDTKTTISTPSSIDVGGSSTPTSTIGIPTTQISAKEHGHLSKTTMIAVIFATAVSAILVIITIVVLCYRRRHSKDQVFTTTKDPVAYRAVVQPGRPDLGKTTSIPTSLPISDTDHNENTNPSAITEKSSRPGPMDAPQDQPFDTTRPETAIQRQAPDLTENSNVDIDGLEEAALMRVLIRAIEQRPQLTVALLAGRSDPPPQYEDTGTGQGQSALVFR